MFGVPCGLAAAQLWSSVWQCLCLCFLCFFLFLLFVFCACSVFGVYSGVAAAQLWSSVWQFSCLCFLCFCCLCFFVCSVFSVYSGVVAAHHWSSVWQFSCLCFFCFSVFVLLLFVFVLCLVRTAMLQLHNSGAVFGRRGARNDSRDLSDWASTPSHLFYPQPGFKSNLKDGSFGF